MALPLLGLLRAAPLMWDIYKTLSRRPQKPPAQGTANSDDILTLRTDVTELQNRLGTVETNEETQAKLIGQMIRHEEALVRRLIVLTLASVVTGAVAIAALAIAVLR